jgi:hypothetical protein
LPDGTIIAPNGLLLVALPRAVLNNGGDTVRLLYPNGRVADQSGYGQIAADRSLCRVGPEWGDCEPTPGEPNQAGASAPSSAPALALSDNAEFAPASIATPEATLQAVAPRPTPSLPAWNSKGAAITPYALAADGTRYDGVSENRSTPSPTIQAAATPASGNTTDALPNTRAPNGPGMLVPGLLMIAGVAIGGWDWRRSRGTAQSEAEAPETPSDDEAS